MGIDDIIISFGLSYLANNIPQVQDWVKGESELQDHIEKCYNRALKKWTVNDGIRKIEKARESIHFEDLKAILAGETVPDDSYNELIKLWITELRNDVLCYSFIIEHKSEIEALKLGTNLAHLEDLLRSGIEGLNDFRQENRDQQQQMMEVLMEIKGEIGKADEGELARKIGRLVEGAVTQMITDLRLKSAHEVLKEIEGLFGDVIEKNTDLRISFLLAKGRSLSFSNVDEAANCLHQAYLLNERDERLIEAEVSRLLKSEPDSARALSLSLPENNIKRRAIDVCYSDNPENTYSCLPESLRNNYTLRYCILTVLNEKGHNPSFLFTEEQLEEEDSLTYQNLLSWLYIITWFSVKMGGELRLSKLQPIMPETKTAFAISERMMRLLDRTEVKEYFIMPEAYHCYWGYVLDKDEKWIDEIHKLSWRQAGEQSIELNMLEISMLVESQRFGEAFQMIASMRDSITPQIIDYVVLMGYYANDINMVGWALELSKEKGFKLNSSVAQHIAYSVSLKTAAELLRIVEIDRFANENDGIVLIGLCNLYAGNEVNVDILKQHLDGLSDDLTAYAAQVLANSGEVRAAFNLLKPKVNHKIMNLCQRTFIDIMAKLPEEHPNLYKLLIEYRKSGEPGDVGLLNMEFSLDVQAGDYVNAYEAIKLLYDLMPDNEGVIVNYLLMLGRFDVGELVSMQSKVKDMHFASFQNVQRVYQVYLENKQVDFALEFLYQFVNATSDVDARTFYYFEALTGPIYPKVYQNYEIANEGLFAICTNSLGDRRFFSAEFGTEVGEQLLGKKKGQYLSIIEDGENNQYEILHIVNKYGILAAQISQESIQGNNPHLKVIHIDPDHILESLETQITEIVPDSKNYHKNLIEAERKYESGECGIISFVDDGNIIDGYYGRLFSQATVFISPWQVLEGLAFRSMGPTQTRYVLDITGLLVLFEYYQKTGFKYPERFIIANTTYDFIQRSSKNCSRIANRGYNEALRGTALYRCKDYNDLDLGIRLARLLRWIDENCDKEISEGSLSFDGIEDKTINRNLLKNTLTLLTTSDRCLISDDLIIEKTLIPHFRVVTTETYMRRVNGAEADSFVTFLAECNYIGVFLSRDYIINEYEKMEKGQENKMTYITKNAGYNQTIGTSVLQACFRIATISKDNNLARFTITNLMVEMIKAFNPIHKSALVSKMLDSLPTSFKDTLLLRQCLQDAARINNVILLPPSFNV